MNLGNVFLLNTYQLLFHSGIFNLLIVVPLFCIAGYQDYKSREVSGIMCLLLAIAIFVHSILFSKSFIHIILVLVCIFMTFGPIDFWFFGQADFLILAHFITGYTCTSTGNTFMLIFCFLWLLFLFIAIARYRDENGMRWKPFSGIMMPAIPTYAQALVISAILRVVLLDRIFFSGF